MISIRFSPSFPRTAALCAIRRFAAGIYRLARGRRGGPPFNTPPAAPGRIPAQRSL
jgi:hypothetical protein